MRSSETVKEGGSNRNRKKGGRLLAGPGRVGGWVSGPGPVRSLVVAGALGIGVMWIGTVHPL